MGNVIAITGKGGTGKTALAALLINHTVQQNGDILLAIDADPDTNLPDALGVKVSGTIGAQREELMDKRDDLPLDYNKESYFETMIYKVLHEQDKYDLLVMGRPEGSGCYCYANNLLRGIMDRILGNYDLSVVDTAAGLEHLSREVIRGVDTLLVVTDGSRRGLKTAERIRDLAIELDMTVKNMYVVANKVTDANRDRIQEYAEELGLDLIGLIPYDENIVEFDLEGLPLTDLPPDSPAVQEAERIASKLGI